MINSIVEAEEYLAQYYEKAKLITGKDVTVERMWPLLQKVGNPEKNLKVIHVAGPAAKPQQRILLPHF